MHKTTKIKAPVMESTAPTSSAANTASGWQRSSIYDVKVEKAREFETFKQIPKFRHTPLSVINPPTKYAPKEPSHIPPKTMGFDGSTMGLAYRDLSKKEMPDHLVRPPIDEEALMRIKERSKMKLHQSQKKLTKKVSLAVQKAEQAIAKTKAEINLKIKRADKNIKLLFGELKKILDKPDDDIIFIEAPTVKVESAKYAEKQGKFVSFVYSAFADMRQDGGSSGRVNKNQFMNFLRFFMKDLNDVQAADIFMSLTRRLQHLLLQCSPSHSRTMNEDSLLSPNASDNTDLRESLGGSIHGLKISTYGLSSSEMMDLKLDFSILDTQYAKWADEDESLSGVLNLKLTKLRNAEFRTKIDSWKNREKERKATKKRNFDHGKLLREVMEKSLENFNLDRDKVQDCILKFNTYSDDMKTTQWENKIVNNYLAELYESSNHILNLDDLDKVLKNIQNRFQNKKVLIHDFVSSVKQECVMNQHFFSFFDIPDLIVKKKISRKDYEESILKVLTKVKMRYLAEKKKQQDHKSLDQMQITDDDLVPLELFDWVLSQTENKIFEKVQTINQLIRGCYNVVQ
mmetsp:Transcript_13206/g.20584  ORF Transcript_13206/g.20584 Transcript_13206/m.20584 type:complete len:571 (+) Transcript_13206:73-1785(+)